MTVRILTDENVDHRVVHRLQHYGYDVEHVDFAPGLDKGTDDDPSGGVYYVSSNWL